MPAPATSSRNLSLADQLIFERGEFDPLEYLIATGALDDQDYRDWLAGEREELESVLLRGADEAIATLREARAYLVRQGLVAKAPEAGGDAPRAGRRTGSSRALAELCAQRLIPARSQLDLFQDSALAVAEQSVRALVASHHFGAAEAAIERLDGLGGDGAGYRRLICASVDSQSEVAGRLAELESEIVPLAVRALGERAREYLAPLWNSLAGRVSPRGLDPAAPALHASYILARAGLWPQVIAAIERVPDWLRQPLLLVRMAEAQARTRNRMESRRLWSQLCWSHPHEAGAALAEAPGEPVLAARWREFTDLDPDLPVEDFPAWLLIADLRQRELVPASCAPTNDIGRAYAAIHRLLLRHEDMSARRTVNEHNKDLLQHYLGRCLLRGASA